MEAKDYIIGSLTLLALIGLGYNVLDTDTHFCRANELAMRCDRLSGTGSTCYPNIGTRIGSKYCSSGWELIKVDETIKPIVPSDNINKQGIRAWKCSDECIELEI